MGIVVIGDVFIDIKGYSLSPYIPQGRNAGTVIQIHGGVARNVAENIANIELKPTFISAVDNNAMGDDVIEKLKRHKVETKYMKKVENGMGTWLAVFDHEGDVVASISKRPDHKPIEQILDEYGDEIFKDADSIAIEIDTDKEIVPWNIACVAGNVKENQYRGEGVKVAVIDSGIDTHYELDTKDWMDFSDKTQGYKPTDNTGHGTEVAGVIGARINGTGMVGIASKAQLYSVKVLDKENQTTISTVIKAIEWCIENDMDIINMSFGTDHYSKVLEEEIEKNRQNIQHYVELGEQYNEGKFKEQH